MARKKVTPKKGEKGMTKVLRTRAVVHAEERAKGVSSPLHPPSPAQETSPGADKIMKRIVEAEWLEDVGRLPQSLPS